MISEDNTQPVNAIADQDHQIQAIMSSASAHQADDRHHSLDAAQNLASLVPSLHETDGDHLAAADTATEDGVAATNDSTLPSTHDEFTTAAKFETTDKLSKTMENGEVNHSNKQSDNPATAINTTTDGDKNLTQTQQANTNGVPLPVPDGLISAASDGSTTAAVKEDVGGSTDSKIGKHANEQTTGKDLTADIISTALNSVDFENPREHNGHAKDVGLVNACNYNRRVVPAVEGFTIQAVSDLSDTADIAAKNFMNTAGNGLTDVMQCQHTAEVISAVDDVTQGQDTDGTVENFSALDEVTQEHGTDNIVKMASAVDGFVTQQVETDDQHGSKTSDLEQIKNPNEIYRQELGLCKVDETAGDDQGKAEQDRGEDDRSGHVAEPDGNVDGTTEDQNSALNNKQYVTKHNETDTNDKEPKPTTEQDQATKSFIDNNDVELSPEQATDAAVLKDNATTFTRDIPADVRPISTSTSPECQTVVSSQGPFIGTTLDAITDETVVQIPLKEESSSSATGTTTTESGLSSSAFELVSFEKPITPASSEHSKILLDIVDSSPPTKEPDTTTSHQQQDKIKEKQQIDVDISNGETKRNDDIQTEESKHTEVIDSETLKQEEHTKKHQESDSSSLEKSSVKSSSRSDSISVSKKSEEKSDREKSNSKGTDIEDNTTGSDEEHSISVSEKSEEKSDREESNSKGTDVRDSTADSDEEHTDIASENDDTEGSASESNDSEESSNSGESTKGDETVEVQGAKLKTNKSTVKERKVRGKKKMQQSTTKKIKTKAKKPIKKKLNQETNEQREASQNESEEQSVSHESDKESKDSNKMDIESHEKSTVDTKDTSSRSESKTHDSSEVPAQSSEQFDGLNLTKEPEQLSVKLQETAINTTLTGSPSAEADGQLRSTSTPTERSLTSINAVCSSTQNSQQIPDNNHHVVQQQTEVAEPTKITSTEHLHEADLEDKKDKMPTAHDEKESQRERQSEDAIAEKIPVEKSAPVKPSIADESSVGAQDDKQDTDEISKHKEEEVQGILQHESIVENEQLKNVTEHEKLGTANDGAKKEFSEQVQIAKTSKEILIKERKSREQNATEAKCGTNISDEIMNPEYTRSKRPKTATENKTGNKDTEKKVDEKAVTETGNFEVGIQQDEKFDDEQKNMLQEEESAESEAKETNNSGNEEETESGNEGGSEDEVSGDDSLTEEDLDIAEDDGSSSDSEFSEKNIERQQLEAVPKVREVSSTPKSPKSPKFDETQAQEELRAISRQCSPSGIRKARKPPRRLTPANVATATPRRWSVLTPAVPLGDEMRYCLENVEKVEAQLEVCRQRCVPGPPPKRRSHFPYIYNGLAPYFNTDALDCMVRQVKRGQRSQSARYIRPLVQDLVSSETDYNLEKNVQSLPSPKEMLRDKYGNYYPLDRQLSIKRAQARLSFVKPSMPQRYTEHRFEPRTISFSSKRAQSAIAARRKDDSAQDYGSQMTASYKEIEQVRKWAKREHKLWCELKGASEYERTMNDFYHFELYKLHEMRPKTRQNMRQTYETYLSNTSGARQALKECLAEVDAQMAAEEKARKAQESARTKMQHLLSEQSMRACNSKATAVMKPISPALNGEQPQLATPSQLPVNTLTSVDQSKLPTRPHTANALSPNPPPPILNKPPPSATSSVGKLPTIALAFQQVQLSMKSPLTPGKATPVQVDSSDPGFYISVTANKASSHIVNPKPPTRHPQSAKSARHVEQGQGRSTHNTRPKSAAMLH